jgi:hypothetical protein
MRSEENKKSPDSQEWCSTKTVKAVYARSTLWLTSCGSLAPDGSDYQPANGLGWARQAAELVSAGQKRYDDSGVS